MHILQNINELIQDSKKEDRECMNHNDKLHSSNVNLLDSYCKKITNFNIKLQYIIDKLYNK